MVITLTIITLSRYHVITLSRYHVILSGTLNKVKTSIAQMLERVGQEKAACEEEGRREKRRSDQLGESMTSLRMVNYISVLSDIDNLEVFSLFENCINNLSFN